MLSFGIRFGQGFDKLSLFKVMQSTPLVYDYDFLVLGCNPGGIACAKEASSAGKKVAIIKWKTYTPAEKEGFDEDLELMANALEVPENVSFITLKSLDHENNYNRANSSTSSKIKKTVKGSIVKSSTSFSHPSGVARNLRSTKTSKSPRGVRQSRLDLNNEFFKRGQEVRKLMHRATLCRDAIEDARNCGWRVNMSLRPPTINWNKMSEQTMDFVMKKNWELMTELNNNKVEIIEGTVTFIDSHTVKLFSVEREEQEITSKTICIASSSQYVFPENVKGATEFGINCDDFTRLSRPPGKTLIVGTLPEGLECAGIAISCQNPVTLLSSSKTLKGFDTEMSQLIIKDLKARGVVFLEDTTLKSIKLNRNKKLLVTFGDDESDDTARSSQAEFDTVIFAVEKEASLEFLNLKNVGIALDTLTGKIRTDEREETSVPGIYAVGDPVAIHPNSFELSELAGKLLGKRLFKDDTELMDYSMAPFVVYTPVEYAYIGISEDLALLRLGEECVDVYHGYFKPIDFVLPPKEYQCYAKVVVLKPKDLIIGLHFFGPEAGEVIQGFAAAVKLGLTMKQLQSVVGAHATKAQEILKLKDVKTNKTDTELSALV